MEGSLSAKKRMRLVLWVGASDLNLSKTASKLDTVASTTFNGIFSFSFFFRESESGREGFTVEFQPLGEIRRKEGTIFSRIFLRICIYMYIRPVMGLSVGL